MVSLIGPAFAGIFIIELENKLVPKLRQHIQNQRRYGDDNFAYMKNGSIEYVLPVIETKFTCEKDVNNTLPFQMFCLLETQITFIQPCIEKKPTMIYSYIGMHLRLHLGNVKHSELWLIEPVLFAPTTILYTMS